VDNRAPHRQEVITGFTMELGDKRLDMGKTFVKVKMWNFRDQDKIKDGELNPIEVDAQVDKGATTVVLTPALARELNLERAGKVQVRYANEKREMKEKVIGLALEIGGRIGVFNAIIEPERERPLIGQIVLEDLDFLIDSKSGTLIPNPASPDLPLLDAL